MFKRYLNFIYSIWSHIYDLIIDRLFHFDRARVIAELHLAKEDHLLEIGVGTGLNLPFYPKTCRVTAIDFSQSMLKKAKEKECQANVNLLYQDATTLLFKENSFDHALATYVLRVAPHPKKILAELSRVVKPGGQFIVLDQFAQKKTLSQWILRPFKLILGWGNDHYIDDLLEGTSWKIKKNIRLNTMQSTFLITLKNEK